MQGDSAKPMDPVASSRFPLPEVPSHVPRGGWRMSGFWLLV